MALVWVIPLTGQLGMNPILSVSLMIPLLPTPAAMGVSPTTVVTAITGGKRALSGVTSPFTASVLLAGSLGQGAPAAGRAGLERPLCGGDGGRLSLWVVLLAWLL